jgi:hypothetical protein
MSALIARIRNEPALVSALIAALVALVTTFITLTPEQVAGILAATAASLGLFVRSQVTPVPPTDAG